MKADHEMKVALYLKLKKSGILFYFFHLMASYWEEVNEHVEAFLSLKKLQ